MTDRDTDVPEAGRESADPGSAAAPVFIGDELTAAGYRLAGARVRICAPGDATAELVRALETAPMVLLAAAHAEAVPRRTLGPILAAESPPVLVVGDGRGTPAPDVGDDVRRDLGVES